MVRKGLLLILLCVCMGNGLCSAQRYFNVRDPLNGLFAQLDAVSERNGKYYCAGWVCDSSNYLGHGYLWYDVNGIKFAVFDQDGRKLIDTVYQQRFIRNFEPGFGKLIPYGDKFLYAIRAIDTTGCSRLMLLCFDTLGRVPWFREYGKPFCSTTQSACNFWQAMDLRPDNYGNWLMLSTSYCPANQNNNGSNMMLTKLDSGFNVIWHKDYGNTYWNTIPNKLLINNTGYVIAGNYNNGNHVGQGVVTAIEIDFTDTAGNVRKQYTTNFRDKVGLNDIIATSDGGYIFCGATIDSAHVIYDGRGLIYTYLALLVVEKLDSSGKVVWQARPTWHYQDGPGFTTMRSLPNGDVVCAGTLQGGWDSTQNAYDYHGMLIYVTADGKVKWRRYYDYEPRNLEHYIYDLKPTSDGGYIMCGEARASWRVANPPLPNQRGWLLKVDSNGCASATDVQCHPTAVPSVPVVSGADYHVAPNPVPDELLLSYKGDEGAVTFLLADLTGRLVRSAVLKGKSGRESIDMRSLVPGIYLYRFIGENGKKVAAGKVTKQ